MSVSISGWFSGFVGMCVLFSRKTAYEMRISDWSSDVCSFRSSSKPYAFEARPWELTKTLGIDMMDAVGTNVRIDSRGRQVLRVMPRVNDDVNEEWASDKTRHHVDGLLRRRLDRPYVRRNGTDRKSKHMTSSH